jgi:multiple sugar transport system substrate-binding protein
MNTDTTRRTITRRQTSGLALGSTGVLLAACAGPGAGTEGNPAAAKKPITLRLLSHNNNQREIFKRHDPAFMAQNPHITIEYMHVPDAELREKTTTLFVAGDGPELHIPQGDHAIAYIDRGWAAEVDYRTVGLRGAQGLVDAYAWQQALDQWKWKGKYYGMPTEISNYCLWINNKLYRDAGLDPQRDYPKDWDQMLSVARRLTKTDGSQITQRGFDLDYGRVAYHWGGNVYQLSGPILSEDGKVNVNNEGAIRTLQYWTDWGQKHQLGGPKLQTAQTGFRSGNVAMWVSGAWYSAGLRTNNPDLFADVTIKPYPRWKDKKHDHGTHVYGYSFLVSTPANTDVRADAWKLAWYFSGFAPEYLAANGLLIPKKDFVESAAFKNFKDIPGLDVFLDDMRKSTYFPKTTVYGDVSTALRETLSRSWTDGQPARQVLPETQKELERIMAQARR